VHSALIALQPYHIIRLFFDKFLHNFALATHRVGSHNIARNVEQIHQFRDCGNSYCRAVCGRLRKEAQRREVVTVKNLFAQLLLPNIVITSIFTSRPPSLRSTSSQLFSYFAPSAGIARSKILRKVSALGIPFGSSKNRRRNFSRSFPKFSISVKFSPLHIIESNAITKIFTSLCRKLPHFRRKSVTFAQFALNRLSICLTSCYSLAYASEKVNAVAVTLLPTILEFSRTLRNSAIDILRADGATPTGKLKEKIL
jgi:hypothetical protein